MDKFQDLNQRVSQVLAEDQVGADLATSELVKFLGNDSEVFFEIIAKESLVFCGRRWSQAFEDLGWIKILEVCQDGTTAKKGSRVLYGSAKLSQTLSAERSLLNGLQRWSGVATLTKICVSAIDRSFDLWTAQTKSKYLKPRLLHTRKTMPMWRDLEIEGVLAGGGHRHRSSLSSQPMIKENHKEPAIKYKKDWAPFLKQVITSYPDTVVEVETWNEARQVAELGASVLLLDNFLPEELNRYLAAFLDDCVRLHKSCPTIEVSGGITPSNLEEYVIPGVSRISMGALTHSYRSVDLSLNVLGACHEV